MNAEIYSWIWNASERDIRVALFKMIERCPAIFTEYVVRGADPVVPHVPSPDEWESSGTDFDFDHDNFPIPSGARYHDEGQRRDRFWCKSICLGHVKFERLDRREEYSFDLEAEETAKGFPLNEKILAIKHIRAKTGCGLLDAKQIYEQFYQDSAPRPAPKTELQQAVELLERIHWTGHLGGEAGSMFDERGGCESWMRERNQLLDKLRG